MSLLKQKKKGQTSGRGVCETSKCFNSVDLQLNRIRHCCRVLWEWDCEEDGGR